MWECNSQSFLILPSFVPFASLTVPLFLNVLISLRSFEEISPGLLLQLVHSLTRSRRGWPPCIDDTRILPGWSHLNSFAWCFFSVLAPATSRRWADLRETMRNRPWACAGAQDRNDGTKEEEVYPKMRNCLRRRGGGGSCYQHTNSYHCGCVQTESPIFAWQRRQLTPVWAYSDAR